MDAPIGLNPIGRNFDGSGLSVVVSRFDCSDAPPVARFSFSSLIISARDRFLDEEADGAEIVSAKTSSSASSSCLD